MKKLFARFAKNESGVTAIEYGLLAALVGVAIIVGATALGQGLGTIFEGVGATVGNTPTAPAAAP